MDAFVYGTSIDSMQDENELVQALSEARANQREGASRLLLAVAVWGARAPSFSGRHPAMIVADSDAFALPPGAAVVQRMQQIAAGLTPPSALNRWQRIGHMIQNAENAATHIREQLGRVINEKNEISVQLTWLSENTQGTENTLRQREEALAQRNQLLEQSEQETQSLTRALRAVRHDLEKAKTWEQQANQTSQALQRATDTLAQQEEKQSVLLQEHHRTRTEITSLRDQLRTAQTETQTVCEEAVTLRRAAAEQQQSTRQLQ